MREQVWLDDLFSSHSHDQIYNIAQQAETRAGVPQPESMREKTRQRMLGHQINLGRIHDDEARKNMSDARKGKRQQKDHVFARFASFFSKRSEYIFIHPTYGMVSVRNFSEFAREYNLDTSSVVKLVKGKYSTHKGWRYLGEFEP